MGAPPRSGTGAGGEGRVEAAGDALGQVRLGDPDRRLIPFPPIDSAFDEQTQQKSLTGVTGDAEENRWQSSVASVTPVRANSVRQPTNAQLNGKIGITCFSTSPKQNGRGKRQPPTPARS